MTTGCENMRGVMDNLREREFDTNLHTAWVDEDEGLATFPLWNLNGRMVGYQQYRPFATKEKRNDPRAGRYFTYRLKTEVAVWGLESYHLTPGLLFVTEGVFDATRLTHRGVSAVAVLSNDPTPSTVSWLRSCGRLVVAVCDSGPSGRKLAKLGDVAVTMEEGDLGDADATLVDNLVRRFLPNSKRTR